VKMKSFDGMLFGLTSAPETEIRLMLNKFFFRSQ